MNSHTVATASTRLTTAIAPKRLTLNRCKRMRTTGSGDSSESGRIVRLDAISSQDGGLPEIEPAKILANLIQISDDHCGQPVWIEMTSGDLRHLVRCNSFDTRHEVRVVIVRQVEQRDLGNCAGDLI